MIANSDMHFGNLSLFVEVRVQVYDPQGDALSDEDRAALHRSLRRGIAQGDAG